MPARLWSSRTASRPWFRSSRSRSAISWSFGQEERSRRMAKWSTGSQRSTRACSPASRSRSRSTRQTPSTARPSTRTGVSWCVQRRSGPAPRWPGSSGPWRKRRTPRHPSSTWPTGFLLCSSPSWYWWPPSPSSDGCCRGPTSPRRCRRQLPFSSSPAPAHSVWRHQRRSWSAVAGAPSRESCFAGEKPSNSRPE